MAGPDIDPLAVSRELGVTASYSNAPSSPNFGVWVLETRDHVQSVRLRDHLDWLSTQLAGHRERLAALAESGTARLLVNGHPAGWQLDANDAEMAREQFGVMLEFVVFVPGPRQIQVDEVRYQE